MSSFQNYTPIYNFINRVKIDSLTPQGKPQTYTVPIWRTTYVLWPRETAANCFQLYKVYIYTTSLSSNLALSHKIDLYEHSAGDIWRDRLQSAKSVATKIRTFIHVTLQCPQIQFEHQCSPAGHTTKLSLIKLLFCIIS